MRIVGHVADRIDVDEARHGGDDDQHHRGQRVEAQHPVGVRARRTWIQRSTSTWSPPRDRAASTSAPAPSQNGTNTIQDSTAATISSPLVTYSLALWPMTRPAAPRQGADQRKEDDGLDHSRQPFIMLTSSTAMVPRLR